MHKANRPIAMSNFLLKALDSLLLARKVKCMEKEGCGTDPAIMAYRKGIGREMALLVISESVLSKQWQAKEDRGPIPEIILLLLDVQHAFNGVNRKHLEVLQWDEHGIRGQLWLLSRLLTQGLTYTVKMHDVSVPGIPQTDGMAQGMISSAGNFNIAVGPVAQGLRRVKGGLDIHEFKISRKEEQEKRRLRELKCRHIIGTVYSDDSSSVVYRRKLQQVLDELTRVSGTHHLRIHTGGTLEKPKAMLLKMYPPGLEENKQAWELGGEAIADVSEAKLLGRICGRKIERSPAQVKAVVTNAKRATRMVGWLNLYCEQSSLTLLKMVFESLVTSVIVAGTTHTQLTEPDLDKFRSIQATAGRRWLRSSALCSQWCVLQELGWTSTDGWIMFAKARLVEAIKNLPEKEDALHVLRARIADVGRGDNRGLVAEVKEIYTRTPTPDAWCDMRKRSKVVYKRECKESAFAAMASKGLAWTLAHPEKTGDFKFMLPELKRNKGPAWHIRNGSRREAGLMTSARCGAWEVTGGKSGVHKGSLKDAVCPLCVGGGIDSVSHILMQCQWKPLREAREVMMANVQRTLSASQRAQWDRMTIDQGRRVLLGERMGLRDVMRNRKDRDQAVKKFMVQANDRRMHAGMRNLCGHVGGPPAFSLEEAMQWAREDPDGDQDYEPERQD
jgi:hypothetical protein